MVESDNRSLASKARTNTELRSNDEQGHFGWSEMLLIQLNDHQL